MWKTNIRTIIMTGRGGNLLTILSALPCLYLLCFTCVFLCDNVSLFIVLLRIFTFVCLFLTGAVKMLFAWIVTWWRQYYETIIKLWFAKKASAFCNISKTLYSFIKRSSFLRTTLTRGMRWRVTASWRNLLKWKQNT